MKSATMRDDVAKLRLALLRLKLQIALHWRNKAHEWTRSIVKTIYEHRKEHQL